LTGPTRGRRPIRPTRRPRGQPTALPALASLGADGLAKLSAALLTLDPEGRFVSLDVEGGTVRYALEIIQHSEVSSSIGEEEPCRAYLVAWLCTEGGYLPANIELEKAYSIGRPKRGARLDILLKHPDGTTYSLIEVKSPAEYAVDADRFIEGQLFNIAPLEPGRRVLAYATVDVNGEPAPSALSIEYADGDAFASWVASGRPSAASLPVSYGQAVHEHLVKGGANDLRPDVPQVDLDRLRKRLHDVLWRGTTPDNDVYEHVVRLFLAKIYDEKTTDEGDRYRFQRHFTGVQPESAQATFDRVQDLYREAYERYLLNPGGAIAELDSRKFSPEQTAFVVELLQGIALTSTRSGDVLGGFFEGITREGFKQSKGLFFTHANIATFLVEALELGELAIQKAQSRAPYDERLPYIIDPSCGSGTFLITAMRRVTEHIEANRARISRNADVRDLLEEKAPVVHPNRWAKEFIFGIDDSDLLSIATKVNMVLHRDGSTHIYKADGVAALDRYADQRLKGRDPSDPAVYSKRVANSFDAVLSNPPFSITLVPSTIATLATSFELAADPNSENLFLERWYQLLKPGGRLGVVLPESFFATRENLNARLFLFDHFNVRAVVGIPRLAFEPWTPTKTSLLLAQKKTEAEERAWKDARIKYEVGAEAAQTTIKSLVARLSRDLTARRPMTPDQRAAVLDEIRTALAVLGIEGPADNDDLASAIPALAKTAKAASVAVLSVRRASLELDSEFLVLSVGQIGFKRTKRTEYDRPNDLFQAHSGTGAQRVRVLNLNKAVSQWSITTTPTDPADALSVLKAAGLWR